MSGLQLVSEKIGLPNSLEEINEYYYQRGYTDGLPVVPPTEDRVNRMIQGTTRQSLDIVAEVPPVWGEATVEKIAINAVMAGCLPEYMPIIIAAVEAMTDKRFNLYAVHTGTHPAAPLIIVNGPIVKELHINSGFSVFGQGTRANATIGRAMRLILINSGGGMPGREDMATQGSPCQYSFCIAEAEDLNPWQPLHVERGFEASASTVTVMAAENPHNINDHSSIDAHGILTTICGTIAAQGSNNVLYQAGDVLLVLGPEHAATIANSGFSKQDVKRFIFEKSRIPKSAFSPRHQADRFADFGTDSLIPVTHQEDAIMVVVAGGVGKHSAFCPNFGFSTAITRPIQL